MTKREPNLETKRDRQTEKNTTEKEFESDDDR